jgi:hypothetical protein
MASSITRDKFPLVKALERVKKAHPELWKQMVVEMRNKLGAEAAILVRAPVAVLQVSQGRAQVAEEVLALFERCSELNEEVERLEGAPAPSGTQSPPPIFR